MIKLELVSWTLTLDKMLISYRCICGLMRNLIKKSWTVPIIDCAQILSKGISEDLIRLFESFEKFANTKIDRVLSSKKSHQIAYKLFYSLTLKITYAACVVVIFL